MRTPLLSIPTVVGLAVLSGIAANASASAAFAGFSSHYEAIRLELLADSLEGVAEQAEAIEEQAAELLAGLSAETAGVSADNLGDAETALREIEAAAAELSEAADLEAAREDFFALTQPMAKVRTLDGEPATIVAYCPMAEKAWIQPPGEIGNPYLGQEMPKCGQIVDE